MFDPFAGQPRRVRLFARRRSRCWKCDGQMVQREKLRLSPWSWWCPKCHHVVSYSTSGKFDSLT